MDMQQMPMGNMHNTFWRDDQISILFQSAIPLVVGRGLLNKDPLQALDLSKHLEMLNRFLQEKKVPVILHFLDESDKAGPVRTAPSQSPDPGRSELPEGFLQLPPGVYPFGLNTPNETQFGLIRTSFVGFFLIKQGSSQDGSGSASMEMHGSGSDDNNNGDENSAGNLVPRIVRILNENLEELNRVRQIPITTAAPVWLSGGTPGGVGQGCPLTPAIPVEDSCSNWHIELPHLLPDIQSKTGNGVTVLILDSFPERGVIARAAEDTGDDNLLLSSVNETVTFDYSFMSGIQDVQSMAVTKNAFVGKDVYGRHYPILLADHGLYIAGIVRDIAPDARIECIRVLNDLCVGDVQLIANALWRIYYRKALHLGDLYDKPVVINLSLVIPTDDEANSQQVNTAVGGFNNVWANLKHPLQSLSDLGVIIVASAGNEADLRESPGINRPNALYPAKFAYAPDSINGVIPVGAVDSKGAPTSYSCYPGPRGVATYGGEVPTVTPPNPPPTPSSNVDVKFSDALRGIYSSVEYPPLLADPPEQYYTAPNDHAWASWVGTSFATPIISALSARILEWRVAGHIIDDVHQAILDAATDSTLWDRLDPSKDGSKTAPGKLLTAVQKCIQQDSDEGNDQ